MSASNSFFDGDELDLKRSSHFTFDIESIYPRSAEPADIFADLTHELQKKYHISKGVLIVRGQKGTQYEAIAMFTKTGETRRLSLKLPTKSSLFEIAAEDGGIYTENYYGLFSGNNFEKNLLLDKNTESFMLHPIKCDGRVVAIIGYSSDVTDAFITFDDDMLAEVGEQLGHRIVASYPQPY